MMFFLASALLAVAITWALTRAFFYPHSELPSSSLERNDDALRSLREQRARTVQMLKDLELDYSTGKVPQEDYQEMRARLGHELAQILEALERTTPSIDVA